MYPQVMLEERVECWWLKTSEKTAKVQSNLPGADGEHTWHLKLTASVEWNKERDPAIVSFSLVKWIQLW